MTVQTVPPHLWPEHAGAASSRSMKAVILATSISTGIEWCGSLIYDAAAALVFNTLLFPKLDPIAGTLVSLGIFAVVAYFGDAVGVSVMLVILAGLTFAAALAARGTQQGGASGIRRNLVLDTLELT